MRIVIFITLILLLAACAKKEVRDQLPEDLAPAEFVRYGDQFYQNGDFDNAFRAYGFVYYNHPTSRDYIDAAIGLSKCYGAMQNYEKEFEILYDLLKQNLIPTKVPRIYNSIAEFYEKSAGISEQLTGETDKDYLTAIDYYKKAIDYPSSKDAVAKSFAQYKIGTLYEEMENFPKAMEAYELALNSYNGTEWSLRAEQNIYDLNVKIQRREEYRRSGLLPDEISSDDASATGSVEEITPPPAPTPAPDTTNQAPAGNQLPADSTLVEPDTSGTSGNPR